MYLNVAYECDQQVSERLLDSRDFLSHLCRQTEPFELGGGIDAIAIKLSCFEGGFSGWQVDWTRAKKRRNSRCRDSNHNIRTGVCAYEINAPLEHRLVLSATTPKEVATSVALAIAWAVENGLEGLSDLDAPGLQKCVLMAVESFPFIKREQSPRPTPR